MAGGAVGTGSGRRARGGGRGSDGPGGRRGGRGGRAWCRRRVGRADWSGGRSRWGRERAVGATQQGQRAGGRRYADLRADDERAGRRAADDLSLPALVADSEVERAHGVVEKRGVEPPVVGGGQPNHRSERAVPPFPVPGGRLAVRVEHAIVSAEIERGREWPATLVASSRGRSSSGARPSWRRARQSSTGEAGEDQLTVNRNRRHNGGVGGLAPGLEPIRRPRAQLGAGGGKTRSPCDVRLAMSPARSTAQRVVPDAPSSATSRPPRRRRSATRARRGATRDGNGAVHSWCRRRSIAP